MKRNTLSSLAIWALIAVSLLAGSVSFAQPTIEYSGQVRYRSEFMRKQFNSDMYKLENISYLRTRFNVAAKVNDNAHAFIQFQDSRIVGGKTIFSTNQSSGLNDGKNVDLHQAYLKLDNLFGEGWGAQLGRFEVNFGNQRVFGGVGWHNIGRSFEGGSFWYDNSSIKISSWCLKVSEAANLTGNRDFDIHGFSADIKSANASFFAIHERNASRDGVGNRNLDRLNVGGHIKKTQGNLDFESNFAYQGGKTSTTAASATKSIAGGAVAQAPTTFETELDVKAFLFTGEIGYNFPGPKKLRLAIGADVTSGDDDPTDTDFKSFNDLYYTGHKFRGYMDYFLGSNFEGLMDLMFRAKFNPTNGWIVKGDVHYFKTMQDYVDPSVAATTPPTMTSDVGMEFDFSVVTTRVAGAKIVSGVSVFLAKDSYAGSTTVNDPGVWGYSQIIVGF